MCERTNYNSTWYRQGSTDCERIKVLVQSDCSSLSHDFCRPYKPETALRTTTVFTRTFVMPKNKKFKWSVGLEEKLIDYFERNSILYNTNDPLYKDTPRKHDVYKKIGERLGVSSKIIILSLIGLVTIHIDPRYDTVLFRRLHNDSILPVLPSFPCKLFSNFELKILHQTLLVCVFLKLGTAYPYNETSVSVYTL